MITTNDILFLLQGVPTTLLISIFSFILGFIIGIPISLCRSFKIPIASQFADAYEKIFRGIPILVFMLFFHFGLGGIIPIFKDPFMTSVIALGMRSGAYQSQIFRGAINSVGRQQMMAAISLGMKKLQALRYVILPQAFIVALPGLGSEIALLIKDSAYSFVLGVLDLAKYADILRRGTRSFIFPYLAAAIIYVILTFPFANYLDKLGSRLKTKYGLR